MPRERSIDAPERPTPVPNPDFNAASYTVTNQPFTIVGTGLTFGSLVFTRR